MSSQWIKQYICYIQNNEIIIYEGSEKINFISWDGSIEHFDSKLEELLSRLKRGRAYYFDQMILIFDSSITNYMTAEWPVGISKPDELKLYVNSIYHQMYGGSFCNKKVVLHDPQYGKPCFSSSFDMQLFELAIKTIKKQRYLVMSYWSYIDFYFHLNDVKGMGNALWIHNYGDYASIVKKRNDVWECAFTLRFTHSILDKRVCEVINILDVDDIGDVVMIPDSATLLIAGNNNV